jgi:peptidoglycan/LPS O-acetylase OafA/YrhL
MTHNVNKVSKRFTPIDALRGIAALLVVWQHTAESFVKIPNIGQNGTELADISTSLDFGRIGIMCFFLISGYVIPYSFSTSSSKPIRHFAIRRVFRLYPAYWLSLILITLYLTFINTPFSTSTVIANITMLQSFFSQPHMIGLYWTLQVELIFYGLCALLFYFRLLNQSRIIMLLISLFFMLFVMTQSSQALFGLKINFSKEFQLFPYLLSTMFLGSLYRKLHETQAQDTQIKRYVLLATFMCLGLPLFLLMTSLFGFDLTPDAFRFGISHSLAFLLFYIGVKVMKKPYGLFIWLGTISYSIYLLHPIILQAFVRFVLKSQSPFVQSLHLSIYLVITMGLSIICATLVYNLVEKPAINLGRKISNGR